jgi:hypothetical protein
LIVHKKDFQYKCELLSFTYANYSHLGNAMPIPFKLPSPKTALALGLLTSALGAHALEYPIGTPQQRNGMEIAAVYLQPVVMEPDGMMRKAKSPTSTSRPTSRPWPATPTASRKAPGYPTWW